jgi:acyl phosphate:glycerol-3-phosphate acyltransferase
MREFRSSFVAMMGYFICVLGGYICGSLPTGYLVGRARGIDIRQAGSGNIGATNVFRILGRTAGVAVLLVDALKGYAASAWLASGMTAVLATSPASAASMAETGAVLAGIAAILGHNYTCWLRFRGGKGIATSAGVLAALVPGALLICVLVWVGVLLLSRYVSVASMAAAFCLPWVVALGKGSVLMISVATVMAVMAIAKHHANIQRLLNGTELRIGARPRTAAKSSS